TRARADRKPRSRRTGAAGNVLRDRKIPRTVETARGRTNPERQPGGALRAEERVGIFLAPRARRDQDQQPVACNGDRAVDPAVPARRLAPGVASDDEGCLVDLDPMAHTGALAVFPATTRSGAASAGTLDKHGKHFC